MRVAFASPGWPLAGFRNGVVTYIDHVVPALRSYGVDARVLAGSIAGDQPTGPQVVDLRSCPLPVAWNASARLAERFAPAWVTPIRMGGHLTSALRRAGDVDVLELEEAHGAPAFVDPGRASMVVRLHGPWLMNGPALGVPADVAFRARCKLELRAVERADGVTAPSRFVLEGLKRRTSWTPVLATIIPNPAPEIAPADRWQPDPSRPRRVVFVGRFDRIKGADLVLRAFAEIGRDDASLGLDFVGPDSGLLDQGKAWSLDEFMTDRLPASIRSRVRVHGPLPPDRVRRIRREGSVVVVASRQENFCMTAVEAAAQGCPVVLSDAGGNPELLSDGESALYFRNEDGADLARALARVLTDRELAARLGARARRAAQRFRVDEIARQTLEFYREARARRARDGLRRRLERRLPSSFGL